MIVHLIDGTYEIFRHFYGLRRFHKGVDRPYGAVVGVLQGVLQMIESGDTYLGVATDRPLTAPPSRNCRTDQAARRRDSEPENISATTHR